MAVKKPLQDKRERPSVNPAPAVTLAITAKT
jgi:hypothetical protein